MLTLSKVMCEVVSKYELTVTMGGDLRKFLGTGFLEISIPEGAPPSS